MFVEKGFLLAHAELTGFLLLTFKRDTDKTAVSSWTEGCHPPD